MTKREQLINLLQEMGDIDLVMLHNEYCNETNNYDDEIFFTDEFDNIMMDSKPWEIATRIHFGDFNPAYEYFKFNGYGNIQSICKWELTRHIDIEEIVDYILVKNVDFDNNDILYILDEIEEDSEDVGND